MTRISERDATGPVDGSLPMSKPKKILNNPADVVTEMLDGLVLASDGRTVRLEGCKALVRAAHPRWQGGPADRRRQRP